LKEDKRVKDVGMLGLCHVWNVVGVERFWLMGSRRGVGSAMRMGWFVAQLVINEVFDLKKKKKNSMGVVFFSQFDAYKNIHLLLKINYSI
jgi:hypothetical protein